MIASLRDAVSNLVIVERDLAFDPVPHANEAVVTASLMPEAERGEAERAALALSESLIAELEEADLVLVSTPMHNFTIPSALKAWLDLVVRPNRTFRITRDGKIGLLRDRPVFVVVACGGRFGDDAGAQADFLSPYLRYIFATIGLASFEVLRLEELNRGPEKVAQGLARARRWVEVQRARVREAYRV